MLRVWVLEFRACISGLGYMFRVQGMCLGCRVYGATTVADTYAYARKWKFKVDHVP